jgi:hypothetical protein
MDDPGNVENRNAGNGGDLVKHTVYLETLRFLLSRPPWREGLFVRECHAGRGIYRVPPVDMRCRLLSCLCSTPAPDGQVALHNSQRTILGLLGCWRSVVDGFYWYAGSALINAFGLAGSPPSSHVLDLYEWEPQTRQILKSVLTDVGVDKHLNICVPSAEKEDDVFDGEAYIETQISRWGTQNVILLDPFAMWRQPQQQRQRDRYGVIIDGLIRHGPYAPSLVLFWTWGRAFPIAEGDLNGTIEPVKNGYQDLRGKLHRAGFQFIEVKWRWGLQFAMWVVAPGEHLAALRKSIDIGCRALSDHLLCHGCGQNLLHPQVEVSID